MLTKFQKKIFKELIQGKTNYEIAQDSGVKECTVKLHLHHIYQRLGIHNCRQLIPLALKGVFNEQGEFTEDQEHN